MRGILKGKAARATKGRAGEQAAKLAHPRAMARIDKR
jgi:hypothetical protein